MLFRKKSSFVDAIRWWKNGDHPDDGIYEGRVVRYFRRPDIQGTELCPKCSYSMNEHGYIDNFDAGYIVCPGDWIVTDDYGTYPVKPQLFESTYEPIGL